MTHSERRRVERAEGNGEGYFYRYSLHILLPPSLCIIEGPSPLKIKSIVFDFLFFIILCALLVVLLPRMLSIVYHYCGSGWMSLVSPLWVMGKVA